MSAALAKTMAAVVAALLVATLAALYVTSRPAAGAQQVVAEFRNAFPLLEGMHVRVEGAIAGSVGPIEVSDEGVAQVTLLLNDSIEDARADATAAIRQQDTTGDSYVAFEPGNAAEPLPEVDGTPTILCDAPTPTSPCANSLVAPRFDDLLNAFGPAERSGVQLILTELSLALEGRGEDLNAAALDLRPALVAANEALSEVNSQNAALRPLIEDAEAVTAQAAARRDELARLITSLETTLAVTASQPEALGAGLDDLPETLTATRTALSALADAAEEGAPLARDLEAAAPQLAAVLEDSPGFLAAAGAVIDRTTPTLQRTRKLLRAGTPTIVSDPERVVTGAFDLAPAISNLLTGTLGDETSIKALFGDDSGGVPGAGTLDGFGLGAVTVEPGQPGYENRNWFRIAAVLNCTMFGVPVEPGCLANFLNPRRASSGADAAASAQRSSPSPRLVPSPGGADRGPDGEAPPAAPPGLGDLRDLDDRLRDLRDRLRDRLRDGTAGGNPRAVDDLLDYLLG